MNRPSIAVCWTLSAVLSTLAATTQPVMPPAGGWLLTTHSGNDVLTLSADGRVGTLVAAGTGGLDGARGVVVGPGGDLFVASSRKDDSQVLRFGRDGTFKGVFATGGGLVHPYGLAFGPADGNGDAGGDGRGGDLFVSGQDDDAVSRYDGRTGAFKATFVPAGTGGLRAVRGITFGPAGTTGGDLFVASRDTHEVLRYDGRTGRPKGAFVTRKSGGLSKPIQVHFGPDGALYVGSSGTNAVLRYDGRTGAFRGTFVHAGDGGLAAPSGFAFSPTDGDLYVESRLSDKVLRYDGHTGAFKGQLAGGGAVAQPECLLPWPG